MAQSIGTRGAAVSSNDTMSADLQLLKLFERDLLGKTTDSHMLERIATLASGLSSAEYYSLHMPRVKKFHHRNELLTDAVRRMTVEGMILEFGVHKAGTINHVAGQVNQRVYGFDVFYTGLPEEWRPGTAPKGAFALKELPEVRDNVELVVGLFEDTLPGFVDTHPGPVALLHVDCDLYSSTRTIFRYLGHKIVKGTVIVFDEYFNYPGWQNHEHKAFAEFIAWSRLKYEYVSVVTQHQQVGVVITG